MYIKFNCSRGLLVISSLVRYTSINNEVCMYKIYKSETNLQIKLADVLVQRTRMCTCNCDKLHQHFLETIFNVFVYAIPTYILYFIYQYLYRIFPNTVILMIYIFCTQKVGWIITGNILTRTYDCLERK